MYKLAACPKCHGDLILRHDWYGSYWGCFQCGHLMELATVVPKPHPLVKPATVKPAVRISRRRRTESRPV